LKRSTRPIRAIATVGRSKMARCPSTTTAPAMAPLAAAVAPAVNACSCGFSRWRRNHGAGMMVKI
jgi:hypothetical protein